MSKFQRDKVAWEHVELPCSTLDWRVDFRHALARLRVAAHMCGFARGYAAVCVLRAVVRLRCYTGWVWGWVDCKEAQERHFYSRDNFKLNRTAALTEWRQLLSA